MWVIKKLRYDKIFVKSGAVFIKIYKIITITLNFKALSNNFVYIFANLLKVLFSLSVIFFSIADDIAGTTVKAIIRLASNEYAIVKPISENNCLDKP